MELATQSKKKGSRKFVEKAADFIPWLCNEVFYNVYLFIYI